MIEEAYTKSITLLKNQNQFLPLDKQTPYAHLKFGDDSSEAFKTELLTDIKLESIKPTTVSETLKALEDFDKVIISYHRSNRSPFLSPDFSDNEIQLIRAIAQEHPLLLNIFVNPYPLIDIGDLSAISALVLSLIHI